MIPFAHVPELLHARSRVMRRQFHLNGPREQSAQSLQTSVCDDWLVLKFVAKLSNVFWLEQGNRFIAVNARNFIKVVAPPIFRALVELGKSATRIITDANSAE